MGMEFMSRLNTATSFHCNGSGDEIIPVKVMYKTGASFVGKMEDYKKTGNGVFTWPDGSQYDGEYVNNLRHGKGVQTWADRSQYEGSFVNDLRHGQGSIHWANGETYKGAFFKDRRHGRGTYTWPNGSSFTGTFYMNKKEGYGVFTFISGIQFEGLYRDDEREGPGLMTYKDGRQDVGFWHGERLLRLLTAIPGAFTMSDHPEIKYQPEDMNIPITPQPDRTELVKNILEPPALFNYSAEVTVTKGISELYSEDLDPRSLAVNHQAFDEEFFKDSMHHDRPEPTTLLVWNKSSVLVDLQVHIHKHRKAAQSVGFPVEKVLNFDRSSFERCGPLEQTSEELIRLAAAGNFLQVEELLNSGTVHPDVADCKGYTALIAATVNWHMDTINILLNHGADVNQLNDEGMSALATGIIFYYPIERFHYNIADRYMQKPLTEEICLEGSLSPSRTLLAFNSVMSPSETERQTTHLNHLNRKKSEIAVLQHSKDSEKIKEPDIMQEEKLVAPKVTKRDSRVVLSEIVPVKITVAKTSRSEVTKGEEEKRLDNFKGSALSDDDFDSVLDEGEVKQNEEQEEGMLLCRRAEKEEFDSNISMRNYQIQVTDTLLERCATQLSLNERVVSRQALDTAHLTDMDRARMLAIQISQHERMKDTLELLLKRGANPNASQVPMPVLFFAIKSADVDMVRTLLMKGASTSATLSQEMGGLSPLHIAVAIPGEEGVAITELLLDALADPDVRAAQDDSFLITTLQDEWIKDTISLESQELLGGRTPLHIACARDDHYKNACRVVQLLLRHKANPDLMCNGFSALALAITSGNNLAVDELLAYHANPSLLLTHGVGSALCVASSTEYEHRRTIQGRIQLIDQLIRAGADILAPVAIGPKRVVGTAVDYAYYMFSQDRRIAHMPYHALTHAERETYNARRRLLAHLGDILRTKAVDHEKRRLIDELERGERSLSPSQSFVFTGAGAPLPSGVKSKTTVKVGQVTFEPGAKDDKDWRGSISDTLLSVRKPLFKYCYDCGRSVGVRLSACTRCKEVLFCSKACKLKAWNSRHKDECIRLGGGSTSPKEIHIKASLSDISVPGFLGGDEEKKNMRINYETEFSECSSDWSEEKNSSKLIRGMKVKKKSTSDNGEEDKSHKISLTPAKTATQGSPGKTTKNARKMSLGDKTSDKSPRQKTQHARTAGKKTQHGRTPGQEKNEFGRLPRLKPLLRYQCLDQSAKRRLDRQDHRITELLFRLRGGPRRGPALSAHQQHGGGRDPRRVQSGHEGSSKMFQTEGGRWVYIDNYSFN